MNFEIGTRKSDPFIVGRLNFTTTVGSRELEWEGISGIRFLLLGY
jgi:hypothetical protein